MLIDYFTPMLLLLYKGNMLLHVHYVPPRVRVVPMAASVAEERLAGIFAKNEELLATVFLSIVKSNDLPAQLVQYFKHRGWHVVHLDSWQVP